MESDGLTKLTKNNEFKLRCANVLTLALRIESHLNYFIKKYFIKSPILLNYHKENLFSDLFLCGNRSFSFDKKIEIFREICKIERLEEIKLEKEEIEKSIKTTPSILPYFDYNKICEDVIWIKKIRNEIAHNDRFLNSSGNFCLHPKITQIKNEEIREVTDELLKEVTEKTVYICKGITTIDLELALKDKELWKEKKDNI